MAEITVNIQLSSVALKLRTLRMQSGINSKVISEKCNIAEDDLIAFEMDKKKPTKRQVRVLESFYLNN